MPSVNTRVFFSKTDRAKYISHLDLNHTVIRSIRRSRLPVWQTEGFNPHTYVAFMLPLSLGQEGVREAMDFRLLEEVPPEEVMRRLNDALPPDIRVVEVSVPKRKNTDIAAAEYIVESDVNVEKFREFAAQSEIITEKKTKKGIATVDLKPMISRLDFTKDGIILRLPAGNDLNINPALMFDTFRAQTGESISRLRIVRTHIFCADGEEFE